jgi:heme/copper-type cytochrome/quinol oxidase subunit 4
MDTKNFPARVYRVSCLLYSVILTVYAGFMAGTAVGTFFDVPLAKVLDRALDFGWKDVVTVILLALLGLLVQFHVFWHEEQEQTKP